jgi:hypothetical protein
VTGRDISALCAAQQVKMGTGAVCSLRMISRTPIPRRSGGEQSAAAEGPFLVVHRGIRSDRATVVDKASNGWCRHRSSQGHMPCER